jgi:hypothetical protein
MALMTPYRGAHRPESRLHWLIGAAGELAVLVTCVLVVLALAGLVQR